MAGLADVVTVTFAAVGSWDCSAVQAKSHLDASVAEVIAGGLLAATLPEMMKFVFPLVLAAFVGHLYLVLEGQHSVAAAVAAAFAIYVDAAVSAAKLQQLAAVQCCLGNLAAVLSFLEKPAAEPSCLENPAAGASCLEIPAAGLSSLGNLVAVLSCLGNPVAEQCFLGNPAVGSNCLGTPAAVACCLGKLAAVQHYLGTPGLRCLGNPAAVPSCLGNPAAGPLVAPPVAHQAVPADPADPCSPAAVRMQCDFPLPVVAAVVEAVVSAAAFLTASL